MNITSDWDRDGQQMRVRTITITLDPEDDPDGHINGLVSRERLEAFLRAYARPGDYGAPGDAEDARLLLQRFAFVAAMCARRLEGMQLAARDQWGMGWGTIANARESSRSTVKYQITTAREHYAEQGAWYDEDGLHLGTAAGAMAALEAAARQDDGE